jgi:hypothetical protein
MGVTGLLATASLKGPTTTSAPTEKVREFYLKTH